ncbi:L-histidine N(alpha)-methyltransferase [Calothrix sp. 336/3]|uniref:L-histidine N(alpha)-methyltransferase n=1 Tax=Calothrix sp. 336/3 TaxID=1337936 RepID=UPI0004E2C412|nr:L-histidine N(alpha)-methyltransferase [Calothrix sp. 336/3]AKG20993.1 methyltransferase [Calothrix sp. 336/3]
MTVSKELSSISQRLQVRHLLKDTRFQTESYGADVVQGLTQTPKTLPPRYFYDDWGSQLFEQICELPEYYVTRTETAILEKYAGEIAQVTGVCEIVELGSGSSTKTRLILDAYQAAGLPLYYLPIDVSAGILESSAKQLLVDYPTLRVQALAGTYEMALSQLGDAVLANRMICFLGSTLGNLNPQECDEFLSQITAALQLGEYFLLGVDLQKPKDILDAAYNDRQGVTAAFNLNMLTHVNRLYGGNFDVSQFTHWAFYNEDEQQIEMHLRSDRPQSIHFDALNLSVNFETDETIRTEISRKFNLEKIQQELKAKGLIPQHVWTDEQSWFGLILCQLQLS